MSELTPVAELTLAQLADEYATVRQRMMAWKPALNPDAQRFDALAGELLERHSKMPAENRIQVEGEQFIVPISPRENKSEIRDEVGLYRRIRRVGMSRVLELYSITLGNARKFLREQTEQRLRDNSVVFDSKDERKEFIETEIARYIKTERIGPREIGEPVLRQQAGATAA